MSDIEDIDPSDPCALADALRKAYLTRLTGGGNQRVRFRAGDNEQEVWTHPGGSLAELRAAWWAAEDECRALQGLPPRQRRFAVTAGSRRRSLNPL
ncbi:hypothetical protein [Chelatococcus sp. XZ-Ab1]|uniref:hypothetical protein n=1 Tax=Chelatococcus sp. XZ-Ab1 TaxID=3034027 RepID=UPI0023E46421|nr:hypothetical protein [Chelatococcus sp. XZ-Ab1]